MRGCFYALMDKRFKSLKNIITQTAGKSTLFCSLNKSFDDTGEVHPLSDSVISAGSHGKAAQCPSARKCPRIQVWQPFPGFIVQNGRDL
jgi:hypothetical protein